jgi:uncharacterized membrane protein YoaT (DUF817 family)
MKFLRFLIGFAYQEALSCLFAVFIFLILAGTKFLPSSFLIIPRYDLILILCIFTQIIFLLFKLESLEDLKSISFFHVIGLLLEIFKVHVGSWKYPEFAYTKIFDVPLYSGFMYASVGSYIVHAWKRLQLKIDNFPKSYISFGICFLIYSNFFTHHFIYDFRWILTLLMLVTFYKSLVHFKINGVEYKISLVLSFVLIGFFIWIAENIATFFKAWQYPNQELAWSMVDIGKISSWFLLVIISFIIVALQKNREIKKTPL